MKLTDAQKNKIRKSARGEQCTLKIPDICNNNPETVVWCHFPDESHGIGLKSFDLSGGYGCNNCHDFIDGRGRCYYMSDSGIKSFPDDFYIEYHMRRAQTRSLRRLLEKGILKIK